MLSTSNNEKIESMVRGRNMRAVLIALLSCATLAACSGGTDSIMQRQEGIGVGGEDFPFDNGPTTGITLPTV